MVPDEKLVGVNVTQEMNNDDSEYFRLVPKKRNSPHRGFPHVSQREKEIFLPSLRMPGRNSAHAATLFFFGGQWPTFAFPHMKTFIGLPPSFLSLRTGGRHLVYTHLL